MSLHDKLFDFANLGQRLNDFGIKINRSALYDLNRIRNDIEHFYSDEPREAVREAIAKGFPVAADLFRLAGEAPHEVLGNAWEVMLEVRAVYDREFDACRATYAKIQLDIGYSG